MDNPAPLSFRPIGFIRSGAKFRADAPRQAVFSETPARLVFLEDARFDLAAADLRGFDRIWILFCFHLNLGQDWNAKVRPPVSPGGKRYGVFATRSPHRPNPLGMSCVPLLGIGHGILELGPCDLLDGTPVLDIKPYIAEIDAFPDAKAGWRDEALPPPYSVAFDETFTRKAAWLLRNSGLDIRRFCEVQLTRNPLDKKRKRISLLDSASGLYKIGYRTWQTVFRVDADSQTIRCLDLRSNYSDTDLRDAEDPYGDKEIHRAFRDL